MKRSRIFILIIFIILLPARAIFAQQKADTLFVANKDTVKPVSDTFHLKEELQKGDTITVNSPVKGKSTKDVLALDTTVKFNPHVATLRSLILPGWGQFYNKKYWKIPIVYGALGITAGVFFYNIKEYRLLRNAVISRAKATTADSLAIPPDLRIYSTGSLRLNRNAFRQNIDYSVLVFVLFWGLNVMDATVDAHLKAFNVSSDISMKIRPGFNYVSNNAGISLVFFFRDKSDKPLLPLP
ncbi:MAG: DUF5683 domain-containing protein [Ginsengibacter sp.]